MVHPLDSDDTWSRRGQRLCWFFALSVFLMGCQTLQSSSEIRNKVYTIVSLDLFSQETVSNSSDPSIKSWVGDWDFRRERLDLIDQGLQETRPDVVIFQNSMERLGSVSESDQSILRAGSLQRYEWSSSLPVEVEDSAEEKSMVVAVLRPLQIGQVLLEGKDAAWPLGADGALSLRTVLIGTDKIMIANVLMPSRQDQLGLWYAFVKDRINEGLSQTGICKSKLVVGGYLPLDVEARRANEFAEDLQLVDSAVGFCQNAERCQTGTTRNEIFGRSQMNQGAGQLDRILVHRSARVNYGSLAFNIPRESNRFKQSYGLTSVWPSVRFGWLIKIGFGLCESNFKSDQ